MRAMRAYRTRPDHAGSFRSILVRNLFLKEMGSHQQVLRQDVTVFEILFISTVCVVWQEGATVDTEEAVEYIR